MSSDRAAALLRKADSLESQLNAGANEVGIPDLVAWLRKRDALTAEWVERFASRRNIEQVIANIRDWVRLRQIDRAADVLEKYEREAAYIGQLMIARPLSTGLKQRRALAEKRSAANEDRHAAAEDRRKQYQLAAEEIWKRWPKLSKNAVALRLADQFPGAKANTIRRKLARPG